MILQPPILNTTSENRMFINFRDVSMIH